MDAPRYLTLSDSIDRHRADPAKIDAETLVIAVSSDRLAPPGDLKRLADAVSIIVARSERTIRPDRDLHRGKRHNGNGGDRS